jgi:hypothetical protein
MRTKRNRKLRTRKRKGGASVPLFFKEYVAPETVSSWKRIETKDIIDAIQYFDYPPPDKIKCECLCLHYIKKTSGFLFDNLKFGYYKILIGSDGVTTYVRVDMGSSWTLDSKSIKTESEKGNIIVYDMLENDIFALPGFERDNPDITSPSKPIPTPVLVPTLTEPRENPFTLAECKKKNEELTFELSNIKKEIAKLNEHLARLP